VIHAPGLALASLDSLLYLSAHCHRLIRSGGNSDCATLGSSTCAEGSESIADRPEDVIADISQYGARLSGIAHASDLRSGHIWQS
jgi:hypothetical protein